MNHIKITLLLVLYISIMIPFNNAQFTYCPKFEENIDLKGNDLKVSYRTETIEECAYLCSLLHATCHGFTYWNISVPVNNCFLKNFASISPLKIQANGRISCIMSKFVTTTATASTSVYPKCMFDVNLFYGYTDSTDVFSVNNAGECCDQCHKMMSKCVAFSYLSDHKICHIYSSNLPGKLSRFGTISGVINPALKTNTPLTTIQNNKCIIEYGQFYGQSEMSDFTSIDNLGSCCDLCKNMGDHCSAFSFLNDQKICYIYYGRLAPKVSRTHAVSGKIAK